jgi:hypothetical protein
MDHPTPQPITGERAMNEEEQHIDDGETLASWLAAKPGTTRQDAEQRLAESRRVAWALMQESAR